MLTVMTSRILLSKVVDMNMVHPLLHICYFRKFIIFLANTLIRFIGSSCPENSFRNMMFIVTMGTNMQPFQHMVTYTVESDDVT